ncbi:pyridoxamine 5'-phosphate oxidase family protein [bacterium]|nr:pyridoxamine 5'-phosphate oxidase family protein [bacterium]
MIASRKLVFSVGFMGWLLASVLVHAQGDLASSHDRSEVISSAREIMNNAHFCTLVTLDSDGTPQARMVDPFPPDSSFAVWIGTNAVTRKVEQIRKDPRVTLSYLDSESGAYVTVLGRATLVDAEKQKATHWKESWSSFYSDDYRGSDYLLIRIEPRRIEVVSWAHGLLNDSKTWAPVAIIFPER